MKFIKKMAVISFVIMALFGCKAYEEKEGKEYKTEKEMMNDSKPHDPNKKSK